MIQLRALRPSFLVTRTRTGRHNVTKLHAVIVKHKCFGTSVWCYSGIFSTTHMETHFHNSCFWRCFWKVAIAIAIYCEFGRGLCRATYLRAGWTWSDLVMKAFDRSPCLGDNWNGKHIQNIPEKHVHRRSKCNEPPSMHFFLDSFLTARGPVKTHVRRTAKPAASHAWTFLRHCPGKKPYIRNNYRRLCTACKPGLGMSVNLCQ